MPDPTKYGDYKVLIVDDMFKVRKMMKTMLLSIGFSQFSEAGDGGEAIEFLRVHNVDLILCDWNMPRLKGIDVLRFVRGEPKLRRTPFIMVTGEMSGGVVAEAAETDVDGYLVKPFTMEQLRDKISAVLDRKKARDGIELLYEKGRALAADGQNEQAIQVFAAALKINPKSPRTLLELGRLEEKLGNREKALTLYKKSVSLSPQFLKGHTALAEVYQKSGDRENQVVSLRAAVKISPRNLERRMMLGDTLAETGRKEEAAAVFKAILKEASDQYSDVVQKVGRSLLAIGAYEDAEKALSRALEVSPTDLHLFNDMGIAFRRQGKFQQAVDNYTRALTIAPRDENLMYNLAKAYYAWGKTAQARHTVQKALGINPAHEQARELRELIEAGPKGVR